jgi:hypothetical protein
VLWGEGNGGSRIAAQKRWESVGGVGARARGGEGEKRECGRRREAERSDTSESETRGVKHEV